MALLHSFTINSGKWIKLLQYLGQANRKRTPPPQILYLMRLICTTTYTYKCGLGKPNNFSITCIAGNFRGSKYSWFSNFSHFVFFILVLLLALQQVKVGKVASFVGKIFVVQCPVFIHENHEYFAPQKLPAIR